MFWQLRNLIDMFWQCSQPASTIITHRFLLSSLLGRFADDDSDDVVIMDRCWHWRPSWGRKSKASPDQGHHHHHHEWSIQVKVSETPSPTCFRQLVHISSARNTTRNVFAYKPGPLTPSLTHTRTYLGPLSDTYRPGRTLPLIVQPCAKWSSYNKIPVVPGVKYMHYLPLFVRRDLTRGGNDPTSSTEVTIEYHH